VKLAGVLGLFLAWLGWPALVVGTVATFLLGGAFGVLLLLGGAGRRATVAFGPWMLVGAWIGILAGAGLWTAYLALFGLA
jgi:leader peptidase (prepilin peptidase)/N-methyltransferase